MEQCAHTVSNEIFTPVGRNLQYEIEKYNFLVAGGYDVEVKDTLLVEVLKPLTERKRDVILLHNL